MSKNEIVKDIYHSGINVSNMDKALEFYSDLLGLEIISDNIAEGELVEAGLGLRGTKFRQVYLRAGKSELELFQYLKPLGKQIDKDQQNCDMGIRHIAFIVEDIAQLIKKCLIRESNLFLNQ